MHKYLSQYLKEIDALLASDQPIGEQELRRHLDQIAFMQHERLIHFLVTFLFTVILFLCLIIFLLGDVLFMLPMLGLLLGLLIPYIFHYYFLENSVQRMYFQYDRLLEKAKQVNQNETTAPLS